MKQYFNKNLVMTEEEENLFQKSNNCWICNKFVDNDDEKVRDHCHITNKFGGTAHNLIFSELNKFDVKISSIPNGLEKYMTFFLGKTLVFIDSMQFMNSSLDKLDKNLSDEDFKYLVKEFGFENLEILKQKGAYPYEYINSFKRFDEKKNVLENIFLIQQKKKILMKMVKYQMVT